MPKSSPARKKKLRWWERIGRLTYLRIAITTVAIGALISRAIWPDLKLDAISLGLLIVALVPWVSGLFESLELPGGWKISFRDLQRAAAAIPDSPQSDSSEDSPSYLVVQDLDPELALVALRIEIEKRLQVLAKQNDIQRRGGASMLARELAREGLIPADVSGALQEIIMAGNAAAHGAELPHGAEDFAFAEGPRVLRWMDGIIDTSE